MANTYALGGSPLGLINVKSRPDRTGMSTFNAGKSRNMNVFSYNRGVPQPANVQIGGKEAYAPVSLMSGGSLPNFWPNSDIGKIGQAPPGEGGGGSLGVKKEGEAPFSSARGTGISSDYHNDSSYDTSLLNIIEKLSRSQSAALRPQDFAYCKFLGVYPNNRLMVARRFPSPTKDNIFGKGGQIPKAIMISWRPENEEFLNFTFGEEWMEADADFTNVLNKLGKDFGIDNSGGGLSKAINLIPLPGFTEQIQREILVALKVLKKGSENQPLPSGNPNIIKQAKRRKTVGYGEAASGLKCNVSIKMDCEYEQKFISGIDPTTAWQDILNNIMIFGTSNSSNYGLDSGFEAKLNEYVSNPGKLVVDVISAVKAAVEKIKETISKKAEKALENLNDALKPAKEVPEKEQKEKNKKLIAKAEKQIKKFFDKILQAAFKTISKYKVEIMGIAHALSGSPSAPWHITIGNPIRPFFCAGDMLAGDVTLSFGAQLAFNDLPSNIKASFTLTNARPWGMQEILAKFNAGNLRTVNVKKDFLEVGLEGEDAEIEKALNAGAGIGQYYDGLFSSDGSAIVGQTDGNQSQGASPSTAGSNTGAGNNNVNQNTTPISGSPSVGVSSSDTGGGSPSNTGGSSTKDSGDPVASLESSDGNPVS